MKARLCKTGCLSGIFLRLKNKPQNLQRRLRVHTENICALCGNLRGENKYAYITETLIAAQIKIFLSL
jgi:hypothetical protein